MFVSDCDVAKNNKIITTFYGLAELAVTEGSFNFRTLQEYRYLKFWSHLMIVKLENDEKDISVAFMGTDVVKNYGGDLTGTLLNLGELGQESDAITLDMYNAMKHKQVAYSSGTLDWKNRDYTRWHRICLPIQKGNEICCLIVVDFS